MYCKKRIFEKQSFYIDSAGLVDDSVQGVGGGGGGGGGPPCYKCIKNQ